MPWLFNLDLKLSKTFCLGYLTLKSYLWILNVLDSHSYTQVFRQSGTPDSDGWLLTQAGQEHMAETGPDLVRRAHGLRQLRLSAAQASQAGTAV